jgi:hypothetical protein
VPAGTDGGSVRATTKGDKEARVEVDVEVVEVDVEVEDEEGALESRGENIK